MKKNSKYAFLLVLMAFVFTFSSCNHDVTPQIISYTVTFNSNGGTDVESQTVESGKKAERPSDPAKKATVAEIYTFDGWYTSTDEGLTLSETPFDFDTAVTDNITLYAKWLTNAITHTVKFESNGGSPVNSQTMAHGKKVNRPDDPAKDSTATEYFTFDGWYTSTDEGLTLSETPFDFDTVVTDDITLYAKWIANAITHTVKFESNGGSPVDSQTIPHGKKANRPGDPAKDSTATAVFTFDNWYTSTDEGVTLSEAPFDFDTVVTDDITLYAKWIANENIHTVRFESNDGSNVKSQTIAHGNTATKPDLPMKAGFASMEWYNGETIFDFATPVTEDITLNAKYFYGSKSPAAVKEVGDIVFNDGSTTPYKEGLELTTAQKSAAIAVIFYKGTELNNDDDTTTERTLGVGLVHGEEAYWCTRKADAYFLRTEKVECKVTKLKPIKFGTHRNGSDNFELIAATDGINDTGTAENYVPFYFAKNYKDQSNAHVAGSDYENNWYLPSVAELYQMSKQKDLLDFVGTLCGTNTYDSKYYWSSTSVVHSNSYFRAYGVDFDEKDPSMFSKGTKMRFCVIREFN